MWFHQLPQVGIALQTITKRFVGVSRLVCLESVTVNTFPFHSKNESTTVWLREVIHETVRLFQLCNISERVVTVCNWAPQYWLGFSRCRMYYFRNSLVVVLPNWVVVNTKLLTIIAHTKVVCYENLIWYFRNSLQKLCTSRNTLLKISNFCIVF